MFTFFQIGFKDNKIKFGNNSLIRNRNSGQKRLGGSSHHGSVEMNLTSIHEDADLIPGFSQWVKDLVLLWLWRRPVATYSSYLTPSLGTSTCQGCGPKKTHTHTHTKKKGEGGGNSPFLQNGGHASSTFLIGSL